VVGFILLVVHVFSKFKIKFLLLFLQLFGKFLDVPLSPVDLVSLFFVELTALINLLLDFLYHQHILLLHLELSHLVLPLL
jgi:hypothetical protein